MEDLEKRKIQAFDLMKRISLLRFQLQQIESEIERLEEKKLKEDKK